MELTAGAIADAADGEVVAGSRDARASSFTIDSRLLHPGGCFFALEAARDGHAFVADAFERGATIAVVTRAPEPEPAEPGATLVRVADPFAALAALGRMAREQLHGATVVGVTGSAGKTATKDLVAAAVAPQRRAHASLASYNNEAGLPLTLLEAPVDTEVLVAEMGARFAGNIAELAEIARPRVGVVTHVGMAHAEHLGGRAGIAQVKGELVDVLPADGLAVLNGDCDISSALAARTRARVVRVGSGADADVRCSAVALDDDLRPRFHIDTPWGSADVGLGLRGEHQVENAAMGLTVALWLDVPIDDAVAGVATVGAESWRMELTRTAEGIVVLNDAYNSSPTSLAAALKALHRLPCTGRRIAVIGDMLELGEHAAAEHRAAGMLAADADADLVIAVGGHADEVAAGARDGGVRAEVVGDGQDAAAIVAAEARPGDAVLVKASRAVGLERVAASLLQRVAS